MPFICWLVTYENTMGRDTVLSPYNPIRFLEKYKDAIILFTICIPLSEQDIRDLKNVVVLKEAFIDEYGIDFKGE